MRLHRKLKKWLAADIITTAQAEAITAFEKKSHEGRFTRSLIGLSLFAILMGAALLVAANWATIPSSVKLTAHFLLNTVISGLVFWAWKNRRDLWREGAALVLTGLTLTLMALIGQILHLEGTTGTLMLFWMVAITPLMIAFGRSLMTVIPWMLSFAGTLPFILTDCLEFLPDVYGVSIIYTILLAQPLLMVSAGQNRWIQSALPLWAEMAPRFGITILVTMASASSVLWHMDREDILINLFDMSSISLQTAHIVMLVPPVIALASLGLHYIKYAHKGTEQEFYRSIMSLCVASVLMVALPTIFLGPEMRFVGGVLFTAYWMLIAWMAHSHGMMRILNLAVTVIAIRFYIIYLEQFHDMLNGGMFFIFSGALLLATIWGAGKIGKYLNTHAKEGA